MQWIVQQKHQDKRKHNYQYPQAFPLKTPPLSLKVITLHFSIIFFCLHLCLIVVKTRPYIYSSCCLHTISKGPVNENESWCELQLSLAFDRQLSSTLINFELVQILMRVDKSLCAFDRSWELMRVAKVLAVCCKNLFKLLVVHSLQLWVSLVLSSSIIFVCWPLVWPKHLRVDETLVRTLASQLSSSFDRALSFPYVCKEYILTIVQTWSPSDNSRYNTVTIIVVLNFLISKNTRPAWNI